MWRGSFNHYALFHEAHEGNNYQINKVDPSRKDLEEGATRARDDSQFRSAVAGKRGVGVVSQ